MDREPRGCEADRTGLDRLFGKAPHPGKIIRSSYFAVRAAFAHRINPQGGVGQVNRNINIACPGLKNVEIFGESLPIPRQAFGHHDAWNILYPFHNIDQHRVIFSAARCKADPAIAHHHGGDAVR